MAHEPDSAIRPTSIRLGHDERQLLDAWCAYYSKDRGFKHSRSNIIRSLLLRVPPPKERADEPAEAMLLRRAYTTVFGKDET